MLQLNNTTPFEAAIMLLPDLEGVNTVFAVVKATLDVGEALTVAEKPVPVVLTDKHHGEPATSSIRVPSDVCLGKPATDVLLLGSAWAPNGRPAWQADVSLSAGPVSKTVRVFGDRVWESGAAGTTMAWVTPFERMPLIWERAYGGADQTDKGPTADPRNPVGAGFRVRGGAKPLAGSPLPNLEDPAALISSPSDAPAPAAFAPVAAHWEPRKSYAGTYDAAWQQHRAPYLPADFDPRFFQLAPLGLTVPGHLRGGEVIDVRGATPNGWLRVALPTWSVQVTFRLPGGPQERPAVLDTVIVEPEVPRVVLVWRAALRCDKKALKVDEVHVGVLGEGWQ
jgi:hypothetical protein